MTTGSSTQELDTRRATPSPVSWQAWPLVDGGRDRVIVPGSIVVIACVTGLSMASTGWAVLAAVITSVAFWRHFVPVTYTVSRHGINITIFSRGRTTPWRAIRRCELRADGILIRTTAGCGPAAWLRRRYIPWPHERDTLVAWISQQFGPPQPPGNPW